MLQLLSLIIFECTIENEIQHVLPKFKNFYSIGSTYMDENLCYSSYKNDNQEIV